MGSGGLVKGAYKIFTGCWNGGWGFWKEIYIFCMRWRLRAFWFWAFSRGSIVLLFLHPPPKPPTTLCWLNPCLQLSMHSKFAQGDQNIDFFCDFAILAPLPFWVTFVSGPIHNVFKCQQLGEWISWKCNHLEKDKIWYGLEQGKQGILFTWTIQSGDTITNEAYMHVCGKMVHFAWQIEMAY